jgi:hypothetical protein
MNDALTICQKIIRALLRPHEKLTIPQLIRETGVRGHEILPVVNRMIASGHLLIRDSGVMRLTMVNDAYSFWL